MRTLLGDLAVDRLVILSTHIVSDVEAVADDIAERHEGGEPVLVGREMERLARLAHKIVWVNPRVSASGFSVRAGGMVVALEHCDALGSGHRFEALGEVGEPTGAPAGEPGTGLEAPPAASLSSKGDLPFLRRPTPRSAPLRTRSEIKTTRSEP